MGGMHGAGATCAGGDDDAVRALLSVCPQPTHLRNTASGCAGGCGCAEACGRVLTNWCVRVPRVPVCLVSLCPHVPHTLLRPCGWTQVGGCDGDGGSGGGGCECECCGEPEVDMRLLEGFGVSVCSQCRKEEAKRDGYRLMAMTTAKNEFLVSDAAMAGG